MKARTIVGRGEKGLLSNPEFYLGREKEREKSEDNM